MSANFHCVPVWRELDTEFNDQASESFEGLSALFDLRRMGFLPPEMPEPCPMQEEVLS